MNDYCDLIKNYISLEAGLIQALDVHEINRALQLIEKTYQAQKTIYVFGNGGSASTASHFQNDFNKGISEYTSTKFRFQCLNDNIPTLLAIANDVGYEEIFRFQLQGRITAGDIIMAISGSGNSKNVLNAAEYAKSIGCKIIGFTGFNGGQLKKIADVSLHVPVHSMQITEDVHLMFDHLMMSVFYKTLCGIDHLGGR